MLLRISWWADARALFPSSFGIDVDLIRVGWRDHVHHVHCQFNIGKQERASVVLIVNSMKSTSASMKINVRCQRTACMGVLSTDEELHFTNGLIYWGTARLSERLIPFLDMLRW